MHRRTSPTRLSRALSRSKMNGDKAKVKSFLVTYPEVLYRSKSLHMEATVITHVIECTKSQALTRAGVAVLLYESSKIDNIADRPAERRTRRRKTFKLW
jgi:hypothetical protein